MTKQEFLAFSLPYGLKYKYLNGTFSLFDYECYEKVNKYNTNYNIILYPLSDLKKEIEHNGEKFVPIVELAEIAMVGEEQKYMISNNKKFLSIYFENEESFSYSYKYSSFSSSLNNEIQLTPNQLELFQKLIEWHFDIAGLIEKCEAIDVNTLETNPYK